MKNLLVIALIAIATVTLGQSTSGMSKVFEDDFRNNKNGWFTSMKGQNRSKINYDQAFLILGINDKDSRERAWVETEVEFNEDFVFKAEIKSEEEPKGTTHYGFFLGMSNYKYKLEQGWYGFKLYADEKKAWMAATLNNGEKFFDRDMEKPVNYTPSDYNEVAIAKKGDEVHFYINGEKVYTNDATETSGGSIIFEGKNVQKAYVRNLVIYQ